MSSFGATEEVSPFSPYPACGAELVHNVRQGRAGGGDGLRKAFIHTGYSRRAKIQVQAPGQWVVP